MGYKKTQTCLEHDIARKEHIKELERMHDIVRDNRCLGLLEKIELYEKQLALYDKIMGYDKLPKGVKEQYGIK